MYCYKGLWLTVAERSILLTLYNVIGQLTEGLALARFALHDGQLSKPNYFFYEDLFGPQVFYLVF